MERISLSYIRGEALNPFRIGDDSLVSLIEDIKLNGQLEPVTVRRLLHPEVEFTIVLGFRRIAAMRILDHKSILANVI